MRVDQRGVLVERQDHFEIPPREILPKPLQKPHPPLWCASTGPETHDIAGTQRAGIWFTLLVDPEELKRRIGNYRGGYRAGQVGCRKFVNDRAAPSR